MQLAKVLKESFNVNESDFTDETLLMDFGEWDSLSHMFFITKLEEAYGIEVTGDEIASMQKIADIKKVITSKGKEL
ncbi:acyl carrier protein [Niastella caeni]|nr:acyl carrier protein [Niastella caeni]